MIRIIKGFTEYLGKPAEAGFVIFEKKCEVHNYMLYLYAVMGGVWYIQEILIVWLRKDEGGRLKDEKGGLRVRPTGESSPHFSFSLLAFRLCEAQLVL
jgi:hypothetical protein